MTLDDFLDPIQEDEGMAECPCCYEMTANQDNQGRWLCDNGCNLRGYQQCPSCGKLYFGTDPFCPECLPDA